VTPPVTPPSPSPSVSPSGVEYEAPAAPPPKRLPITGILCGAAVAMDAKIVAMRIWICMMTVERMCRLFDEIIDYNKGMRFFTERVTVERMCIICLNGEDGDEELSNRARHQSKHIYYEKLHKSNNDRQTIERLLTTANLLFSNYGRDFVAL